MNNKKTELSSEHKEKKSFGTFFFFSQRMVSRTWVVTYVDVKESELCSLF